MSAEQGGAMRAGSAAEVAGAFLWLGCTSFGGPIAHLAYFRHEFVVRRRWLSERAYADLLALCQFLPGPASSQVGFALGLMRAGLPGALLAWLCFTLPSALLLLLFAAGAVYFDNALGAGLISGLKIVATAIVAHAVLGMARSLCPDQQRAGIALLAVITVVFFGGAGGQLLAILFGALLGMLLCRQRDSTGGELALAFSPRLAWLSLALFALLLLGLPLLVWSGVGGLPVALLDIFYRAGALVFGGGHVVLPLLEASVVQSGLVDGDAFLAGYGAAQAVPGPLFTFAAYLGAIIAINDAVILTALLALVAIFLPGILLLLAVLPFWQRFRQLQPLQSLMAGVNAAVVGILGAALYDPIWVSAIVGGPEFALALVGFVMLAAWRLPAWMVVLVVGSGGVLLSLPG